MSEVIVVDEPGDVRLRDYVDLTDVRLRRVSEPADGLFIAEGEKVIRRGAEAGFAVRSVLLAERWLAGLADVLDATSAPVYVGSDGLLESVTGFAVHRGALAAMQRRPLPAVATVVKDARRVVVLEDVNDHTNVGLIFRSAAALGVDAVVLAPRCADPLYRRAIKTSMGAVFALPYARMTNWYDGLAELKDAGFRTVALTLDVDALTLEAAIDAAGERIALLLGSEGQGLSPRWQREADLGARIPMANGVDSLNVAAAAAVACYALSRRTGS